MDNKSIWLAARIQSEKERLSDAIFQETSRYNDDMALLIARDQLWAMLDRKKSAGSEA